MHLLDHTAAFEIETLTEPNDKISIRFEINWTSYLIIKIVYARFSDRRSRLSCVKEEDFLSWWIFDQQNFIELLFCMEAQWDYLIENDLEEQIDMNWYSNDIERKNLIVSETLLFSWNHFCVFWCIEQRFVLSFRAFLQNVKLDFDVFNWVMSFVQLIESHWNSF